MELNLRKAIISIALPIMPFFFWGTAMVAMKGVIPHTTPLFVAGVRLLPAGILILLTAMFLGRSQPRGWLAWSWIGFFALVDGIMFQGFLAEGLLRTDAGLGSAIIDSQPLAVAILSSWLFAETIGLWGWLGLSVGMVGLSLISLPDEWLLDLFKEGIFTTPNSWQHLFNSGELLMLLAALSMAVGTIIIRYVCRYVDPIVATGWHMIIAGFFLFLASGMVESQQWQDISLNGWLELGYTTVFGGAIAYGIFFYLASSGSLTSLSSLTFLTPVFALTFGSIFLSEFLSVIQWVGVSLTIVSIYLINQRDRIDAQLKFCKERIELFYFYAKLNNENYNRDNIPSISTQLQGLTAEKPPVKVKNKLKP